MPPLSLLLNTIRHLRVKQTIYQVVYRLYQPRFALHSRTGNCLSLEDGITKFPCHKDKTFTFLNISSDFKGWNDTSKGMLWCYNLNYMDWLHQEGLTLEEGLYWIKRFIQEFETNRIGKDPYPISLRGINWIKFLTLHRASITEDDLRYIDNHLYAQYVFLSKRIEYHIMGNHLLENAFSMVIAAIYFQHYSWYQHYSQLLIDELEEQILPDGAHFEQAPMYHCIILDRLLDTYNISKHNPRFERQAELTSFLERQAELMLGHLESITYSDGSIPLLNDSAYDIAPTPTSLFSYADRLGLRWKAIPLAQCGYRKICTDKLTLLADVGNIQASYQPGHTHADTFSYELRIGEQPLVIDTGISTYEKNERRQYERSSAAHNCVVFGGKNSSEVWGGFRVAKRAQVLLLDDSPLSIKAQHNGYPQACTRSFTVSESSVLIKDEIAANATNYIHLAPNVRILSINSNEIITNLAKIVIRGESISEVEVNQGKISPRYNEFQEIKVLSIHFSDKMQYEIIPTI